MMYICLYKFGWMERHDEEKEKKNIDNIIYMLLAFINQKRKEKGVKIT